MPKVFISYVRQNSEIVDKLADELRRAGVTVWLDREEIMPGATTGRMRSARRSGRGTTSSPASPPSTWLVARTYMSTEIGLAIEMLQADAGGSHLVHPGAVVRVRDS